VILSIEKCTYSYVVMKLEEGEYHGINCPAFGCSKMVPLQLIEMVLSPCMARKFLKFDIKVHISDVPSTGTGTGAGAEAPAPAGAKRGTGAGAKNRFFPEFFMKFNEKK